MKKAVALLAIFSFFLALGVVPAGAVELEKISSPEQIKEFRIMKKEGNTLYGVRLEKVKAEELKIKVGDAAKVAKEEAAKTIEQKLEKIGAPSLIPMYEKIRQVGNALWGLKKGVLVKKSANVRPEAATCVAEAIRVKDAALVDEVAAMSAALQKAIADRSTCQQAAVKVTENQGAELEACVKTFREANRQQAEAYKKAHQAAWETYKASLKACQPASSDIKEGIETKEGATTELLIQDGSEKVMETVTEISQ